MGKNSDHEDVRAWLESRRTGVALANSTLRGTLRMVETLAVLGRRGAGWMMGDRSEWPRLLRETCEELGTTYIKLGQFIASSPSVFPEAYVQEFQRCLDRTPPLPFRYVRDTLETELRGDLSEFFQWVDPKPLASASIAQVHVARLRNGDEVVLKVQKPGVRDLVHTDFNFIYFAARVVETLAPGFSRSAVSGVVEELQAGMLEECNFVLEADHLDGFNEFLRATGNNHAAAPQPYRQLTTGRVLTMERFHGVPLTDLDVLRRYTDDPAETLITALNTWFSSLMLCDFFHADVHAGNLMLLEDGRVGFIDFGIVGRISSDAWDAMAGFFDAIGRGDHYATARAMATIGMTSEEVDVDALARDIEKFQQELMDVDPVVLMEGDRNEREVNRMMMDLLRIGEEHGIRFPRQFALLLKQFLYFDRYVQALAPELDMFNDQRLDLWSGLESAPPAGLLH